MIDSLTATRVRAPDVTRSDTGNVAALAARSGYRVRTAPAVSYSLHAPRKMMGPGVVPRRSDFNYLQCQTTLTATAGAKRIFPHCQTGEPCALTSRPCPFLTALSRLQGNPLQGTIDPKGFKIWRRPDHRQICTRYPREDR